MISHEEIRFTSKADNTGPLFAEIFWDPAATDLPLVAVMHGFSGNRSNVTSTCRRFAERGLCAIAVSMRGRDRSAGSPDAGAVEIHDIADALDAAITQWPHRVDPRRQSIVGYSGGGGNALSAVTKFPDRFQVAVSFFGISDYAYWYQSRGRDDCNRIMAQWIGGSPDDLPGPYRARNSARAAGNPLRTEIHLFWDEQETQCPGQMNEQFAQTARNHGHQAIFCHVSRETDPHRWHHGYPHDNPELIVAEDIFLPRILERRQDLTLPTHGHLIVPGYVVTQHFQFWLDTGQSDAAQLEYNCENPDQIRFRLPHSF